MAKTEKRHGNFDPCIGCTRGVSAEEIYANTMFYADMPNECYRCIEEIERKKRPVSRPDFG